VQRSALVQKAEKIIWANRAAIDYLSATAPLAGNVFNFEAPAKLLNMKYLNDQYWSARWYDINVNPEIAISI